MKTVIRFFPLFVAFLACVSCGEKQKTNMPAIVNVSSMRLDSVAELHSRMFETPSQVAVALFNSLTDGDVETVHSNIHFPNEIEQETFFTYYDMAIDSEDFKSRTEGYRADYRAVSEKIDGDSAYVELVGQTVLGESTRFTVLLRIVDGWWKVDGPYSVFHRQIVTE